MYVLGRGPLATSTADAAAVDNVTLLGLVTETASLVGTRRTTGTVDDLELAKLLMHSQQSSTRYINWERGPGFFIPPSTVKSLADKLKFSSLVVHTRTRIKKRIMSDCFFF
jgi:hypothetical protein